MPNKKRQVISCITNLGLLPASAAMAWSGLVIQLNYHMGHHGAINKASLVLGMTHAGWSDIHLTAIAIVSFLAVIHIILHWKWYKTIVLKKLFAKNHLIITLTAIFIAVAITGYTPLFVKWSGGSEVIRKSFIEIHDKLALVLLIYLMIHVSQKFRWFISSFKKL
jgi:hypothetical protein